MESNKTIRVFFRAACLTALMAFLAVAAPHAAAETPPAFKIYIENAGAYRLDFEDFAAAGLEDPLPSAGLGLTAAGSPVPLWVEDGGDGRFGPGDWIEFVGERLHGEHSYSSEYTRYNAYFLRFDDPHPRRMESMESAAPGGVEPTGGPPPYRRRQHLEEDLLILRLPPAKNGEPEELWYWAKLVHNQKEPFAVTLGLRDLEPVNSGTVSLEMRFRGWSKPASKPDPETADHRVEVSLNGEGIAAAEWNGTRPYLLEVPAVPADRQM